MYELHSPPAIPCPIYCVYFYTLRTQVRSGKVLCALIITIHHPETESISSLNYNESLKLSLMQFLCISVYS